MAFVLRLLVAIAVALSIGFGLSYYALTDGRFIAANMLGPWITWQDVGVPNPNPYTRSQIAREGALQLGRSEGLRFTAATDSAGKALDLSCTYRISGRVPISSFWTLSAVDSDWRNLAAPGEDLALRSSELVRDNDRSFRIYVGPHVMPMNWLELAGSGQYELVLTLYDTTAFSGFTNDTVMPSITEEHCP
ncbi:DUF1214 domain-containing protein [Devosia sp. MC1541]|uniref:DUF1214 domain-containing protein n=1 Tax=Devosia sp. MC1541 TaxID=2725264 RepID=UPI00145D4F6E